MPAVVECPDKLQHFYKPILVHPFHSTIRFRLSHSPSPPCFFRHGVRRRWLSSSNSGVKTNTCSLVPGTQPLRVGGQSWSRWAWRAKSPRCRREKKWDNLKKKYKDCKYPASGEGVSGKTTAATWPWFVPMDEVLGQRPSTRPPVLIASMQEDTPGPSTAVGTQEQDVERRENEAQLEARPEKRKRDREDEVLELIKKDMRLQREIEERRAERMDRIICLLEKVVEKQNE
ncbi:uncharacterized protein LOC109200954 isoform X3 [Oreochromis niloticus]|uniref:uncharacterized protein LOC109200954 isoform X3 n=1 Tax=Oreochromis niloticus TaxID=8128 RepID=UPI000DF3706E|nr:uncharacterized protein LOC109200954 isoform X3 [Oreochromis niloticus]